MQRAVQLLSVFIDCVLRVGAHQHSFPDSRPAYLELPQKEIQSATVIELDVFWNNDTLARSSLVREQFRTIVPAARARTSFAAVSLAVSW